MTIPRARLVVPLLIMSSGCTLASLPYRTTQAVVDPGHGRRVKADQELGREVRKEEQRARRDYERCRRDGRFDC